MSLSQDQETEAADRTAHVQALMHRLTANSTIYSMFASPLRLISATQGSVTTQATLEQKHVNSRGGLHGAVSAAFIDFTTGLAIASVDLRETTGASVDMHISYLSSARVGDLVEIVATADKVGGSMAFATIKIFKVEEGGARTLVTMGQHTKYVRQSSARALSQQAPKTQ